MCKFDPESKLAASWTIRVESYCPTFNSIGLNSKNNFKYRSWRKTWETLFGPWLSNIPPALKYRRVTIVRHYGKGKRAFDRKNFEGGCKPLLDTIKNFGAIYDDSAIWAEDFYQQQQSPDGKDYVEVTIDELCVCHAKCPHAQESEQ